MTSSTPAATSIPVVLRADAALRRFRARPAGEIVWLLFLGGCLAPHLAALTAAFMRPDLIDFAAFVDNARAWVAGTPYPAHSRDPNVPHVILFFVPFTTMPLGVGLALWMALSYACVVATVLLVARELRLRPSQPVLWTFAAALAAVPPMLDVVVNGNMIWPLGLLFTHTWLLARRGRAFAAAALLGALATAKPFVGAFVLLYLARREWTRAATLIASAAATLAIAVLATGVEAWTAWFEIVGRISWYDVRFNASVMGVIARTWRPDVVVWAAAGVLVAGVTMWRLVRLRPDVDRDWILMLLASLLMAPLGWRYYLCLAIGPVLALWARGVLSPSGRVALLLLAWSPTVSGVPDTITLQATIGSLPFWTLACAWAGFGWRYAKIPAA